LSEASKQALKNVVDTPQDIAIVIADGLSANAVNTHAIPVVNGLLNVLIQHHWRIAPIAW
jgi:ethanolamine ammonia-lyase small subunit